MNRMSFIVAAAALLMAHAATAGAQSAPQPTPQTPTEHPATAQPDMVVHGSDSANTADTPTDAPRDRHCLRDTGSRITAAANARAERNGKAESAARCAPAFGRVYTREDIERTGFVNLADALRVLDPSIH